MRTAMRLPPESSTTGTGDALDLLERDHRDVEQLFARASLTNGDRRVEILPDIVQALTAHAQVEEDIVYPAIAAAIGGGDLLTERSVGEHAQIKSLVDRLAQASTDSPELVEDLRELQLVVQAHVAVEEGELFPAYRVQASAKQIKQLTDAAAKARAAASTATSSRK
jgi:hemerythrin superfamily protein